MWPLLVVAVEIVTEGLPQGAPILKGVEVDTLVLDRSPEPLHANVIVTTPATVHADWDAVGLQHPSERAAGELAALEDTARR